MSQTHHRHDLKSELDRSAAFLRTLRDDIRVQLHLGKLEARGEWERLAPRLERVLEDAKSDFSEATREAVAEVTAAAKRFRQRVAVSLAKPVPDWQRAFHARVDPHRRTSALSDLILGGQDGIVAVLGALLGVAAASSSARLVVAVGLSTAFADAISMAAVAYTSMLAQADVYRSEREREYRHIREVPTLEEAEIRDIYARKGF